MSVIFAVGRFDAGSGLSGRRNQVFHPGNASKHRSVTPTRWCEK